jgi:acyl-CoA synthetase (AMP-forming)/AMP-acid ligase II
MAAGAVTVPTYTTNTARDHQHILGNSGAVAAVVSTTKLAKTLLEAMYQGTPCRTLIGMDPLRLGQTGDITVLDTAGLAAAHPVAVAEVAARATMKRGDLACLIYTSGTGGTSGAGASAAGASAAAATLGGIQRGCRRGAVRIWCSWPSWRAFGQRRRRSASASHTLVPHEMRARRRPRTAD